MVMKVLLAEFVWKDLLTLYVGIVLNFKFYADAHSKLHQRSKMEFFAGNYFRKELHFRCLT